MSFPATLRLSVFRMRHLVLISFVSAIALTAVDAKPAKVQQAVVKPQHVLADQIVTGKSVTTEHKRKWAAMRARFVKCGECVMDQAFPDDLEGAGVSVPGKSQ